MLIDDNSKHKKEKNMNINFVATINHDVYENVLLNNDCLRHSLNRAQSKDQRIGTYEINNISLITENIYPKQWIWQISSWLP